MVAEDISNRVPRSASSSLATGLRGQESEGDFFLQTARLLVLTLLGVLLVIVPALAQTNLSNEMLREVHSEIGPMLAPATPAALPDAPAPQKVKVIDKKFIAVMATLAGAESLRFTTHKLVLDHEFAAGAPWVTSVPAARHLAVKYSAIYAAELLVAYELKKPHSRLPGDKTIRKLWWLYPAAMAPMHIMNGVRSIRTQAPSCPADMCGGQ
jgi:hypothetical protein